MGNYEVFFWLGQQPSTNPSVKGLGDDVDVFDSICNRDFNMKTAILFHKN